MENHIYELKIRVSIDGPSDPAAAMDKVERALKACAWFVDGESLSHERTD